MKVKIPILASLTILVTLIAVPLATPRANAILAPPVSDPSNVWNVTGPDASIHNVIMQFYGDDTSEVNAFQAGQLDVMDQGQGGSMPPVSGWSAYESNPDFLITPTQGGSLWHGVYFNLDDTSDGSGTVWHTWGCPFQHGNSACGIEIRQAFGHLLDRINFVNDGPLQGGGTALADDVPPTQTDPSTGKPVQTPLTTQCSWDTLYLANPINSGYQSKFGTCRWAFNIAPNPGGFAAPGSPDFCAAVDHLIRATQLAPSLGLQRDPAAPLDVFGNHCGIDPASPGLANIAAHPMRAKVRSTEPRHTMGLNLAAAMAKLFANNVVNTIQIGSGHVLGQIVFFCCTGGFATDDWEWYTEGYQNTSPYPAGGLYSTYDSVFSSNICGGPLVVQPTNPTFDCVAAMDTPLLNAAQTLDLPTVYTNDYAALNIFGQHALDLPAYAFASRDTALRSVAGLVNQVGIEYEQSTFFLSAHKNTGYTPTNSLYAFNGGGPSDTIRRGESGGGIVANLNPYFSQWVWEFDILGMVYDSLFASSPVAPTQVFCWVCNSFDTSRRDINGNMLIDIELKQNLVWQDGVPITASDVAFSILTERDFAAVLSGNVPLVQAVHINSPLSLTVTYTGVAIDAALSVGAVLLIPQHIWDSGNNFYGQGVGSPASFALDPSYDPIQQGTFIGSGTFECRSRFASDFGKLGTGCVTNSDLTRGGQAIAPGGSMFLTAYDNTASGSSPFDQWFRLNNPNYGTGTGNAAFSGQYQEFSWADRFDNDSVTTRDLAAVAACFGKSSASGCADYGYWVKPFMHGGTATVSTEVAVVASHLDDSLLSPFSWNGVQYMQSGTTLLNVQPFVGTCSAFNPAPNPLTSPCYP
jgi:ABC-type transport system substrate-binding protein